ncbi:MULTISPECIES: DUF397 domain-containing protein [Streptomyces]|uniref:DUF397 domain-containing protein n=1 Tax=Streptomyces TaxID=1883 RepID=UPI002248D19C|nr:DUF397 domain-containing protein [Streptomyces sp. JHD 1]MCX2971539.1 DUF397 domain-containing protein [Streptomyces sp. JHD 1]
MTRFELRESSYGGGQPDLPGVEVATNVASTVAVRDSKASDGSTLLVAPGAWAASFARLWRDQPVCPGLTPLAPELPRSGGE